MGTQNKKNKRIWLITVVVLLVVVALGIYFFVNSYQIKIEKKQKTLLINNVVTVKESGCTRTTRLENKPRYDRALSLIKERIDDHNKKDNSEEWKFFPAELTNCIVTTEKSLDRETQGYYVFNSEETKPNYFPISINSDYRYSDDINTALLLVHEMTHVQQYIDSLNNKPEITCIDGEVSAFIAMYNFHQMLTSEEWMSIRFRTEQDDYPNLAAPLKMIKSINLLEDESGCNIPYNKICVDEFVKNELKKIISKDDDYKKLCEIK